MHVVLCFKIQDTGCHRHHNTTYIQ